MKTYTKTHKSKKALKNHVAKIKARGGKATVRGMIVSYTFPTKNKKVFYTQMNIGKAKYVVNHYDGKKTHKDGSSFYDISIFSNKIKFKEFINELLKKGYTER